MPDYLQFKQFDVKFISLAQDDDKVWWLSLVVGVGG
jgi:hypothetical protein